MKLESVEDLGGVGGQRLIDGAIGQLAISFSKIVIPLDDDNGAALIGGKDIGIGMQGAKGRLTCTADESYNIG